VRRITLVTLVCFFAGAAFHAAAQPYEQHQDLVYGQTDGIGLLMDVFVPTGPRNGAAIVDVASGAWHSDRGKIRDHKQARFYDIFCEKGYVVFAIRPGSVSKFTAEEMLEHVHDGIRYAKAHADDYGVDPERIGITGASAGGHLASLAVVTSKDGDPDAKDPLHRYSTHVKAVGVFFPPTHFLSWGGEDEMPDFGRIGPLLFDGGIDGRSDEEVAAKAREISPALRVDGATPPFLIFHGDADPVVPLQQSEVFVDALEKAGADVDFHIKPGGGHPWLTIPQEVAKMADWFDEKLGTQSTD